MDQKYISEIKAREQAATPGPWVSVFDLKGFTIYDMSGEKGKIIAKLRNSKCKYKQPDAAFIAHARTDIPALLAEVERLTEELESSEKANDIGAKQNDELLDKLEDADQQIATLKKALEVAIDRALPNSSYSAKQAIIRNLLEECTRKLTHETHDAESEGEK